MDDITRIKEQIQMLHERLENVENQLNAYNHVQLYQLQNDINNIKLILKEFNEK